MRRLQDEYPEYNVSTFKECLDYLNWTITKNKKDIKCSCGGETNFRGWLGIESIYCTKCNKGMQNLLGIFPDKDGKKTMIHKENFDLSDDKYWTTENLWDFSLLDAE